MARFRLTIAYDGSAYAGWQVQPRLPTVQQTIEEALAVIVGERCKLHGSGRTDRGVHAVGQVAHFDLATRLDAAAILRALNARLPADIRIVRAVLAKPNFHARRDAVAKEYRYFIWNDELLPPHRRLYVTQCHRPLDLAAMREGAARFLGKHDFAAFMANPNREVESSVRTIFDCALTRRGRKICLRVKGDGFLYKQVRSMSGLLLRIGGGNEAPQCVSRLLDMAQARTARVPSAPPQGLFLWRVWY